MADPIICKILDLKKSSIDEHCRALNEIKILPYWWYQGRSKIFGNFSIPFKDKKGDWWYQVKPGLCWPANFLESVINENDMLPKNKSFFGYQHVTYEEKKVNSHLIINVIRDIKSYDAEYISSKRRNLVRKGLKSCSLDILKNFDQNTFNECRVAWNELTIRTGWKKVAEKCEFEYTWSSLIDCPGVSIIVGRDAESGRVAGFLVTKIIGSTAYVDTIASRSDSLRLNINDALIYSFVYSASKIAEVKNAHYAMRSNIDSLEKFKTGMGFEPYPYPAITKLNGVIKFILSSFFSDKYKRMTGTNL